MPGTIGDLERRLDGMAAALSGDSLRGVTGHVASQAKLDTLHALDADLHGRKFRNWRPKLTVRYTLPEDGVARITPLPAGPWVVLTSGRLAGRRAPRRGRRRSVAWGPTRGKGTWRTAKATITELTPNRIRTRVLEVLRNV